MDDFFKNLKDRFSFDNVVSFMRDARLIDAPNDTPSTNSDNIAAGKSRSQMIDVDGAPIIINDVESRSGTKLEGSNVSSSKNNVSDKSGFNVLKKSSSHELKSNPDSTKSEPEKAVKKPVEIPLYF